MSLVEFNFFLLKFYSPALREGRVSVSVWWECCLLTEGYNDMQDVTVTQSQRQISESDCLCYRLLSWPTAMANTSHIDTLYNVHIASSRPPYAKHMSLSSPLSLLPYSFSLPRISIHTPEILVLARIGILSYVNFNIKKCFCLVFVSAHQVTFVWTDLS